MKFIKIFEYFKEDLRWFTEENLAYLFDNDKFKFLIRYNTAQVIRDRKGPRRARQELLLLSNNRCNSIIIKKEECKIRTLWDGDEIRNCKNISFTWDSVKDHLIPYIQMLDYTYGVRNLSFIDDRGDVRGGNLSNLERIDFLIKEIYITVRN